MIRGGDRLIVERRLGALGLPYVSVEKKWLLLTNAHVAARLDRLGDNAEAFWDDGTSVGTVYRTTRLSTHGDNDMDASVVFAYDDVSIDFNQVGKIGSPVTAIGTLSPTYTGEYFFVKPGSGRKVRLFPPENQTYEDSVELHGRYIKFSGFYLMEWKSGPLITEKDSGSVILRRLGRRLEACGLLFAGTRDHKVAAVYSLATAFARLGERSSHRSREKEDVHPDDLRVL